MQIEENESKRPAKRQKMTRSVSINTILQRVGSREGPLAEVAGTTPLTVQDMVEAPASSRPLDQASLCISTESGDAMKMRADV